MAKLVLDFSRPLTEDERTLAKVAIAKDVLKRLKAGLKTKRGAYVRFTKGYIKGLVDPQKQINKIEKECEVCALGGAFLSYIRLFNSVTALEFGKYQCEAKLGTIYDRLSDVFTDDEIARIEAAYEGDTKICNASYCCGENIPEYISKRKYSLKQIFGNIVKNNGEFRLVPSRESVPV